MCIIIADLTTETGGGGEAGETTGGAYGTGGGRSEVETDAAECAGCGGALGAVGGGGVA